VLKPGIDNYPITYPLVRRLDAIKLKKKKEEEKEDLKR
jgi:hypothetical protein